MITATIRLGEPRLMFVVLNVILRKISSLAEIKDI